MLGCGGVRMLEALGYRIRKYHMNEGHSALLALELLRHHGMDVEEVRERCVFTTHTPIEAGHDRFPYDLVDDMVENETQRALLRQYGGETELNMTLLALNLSAYVNGVAKSHGAVSTRMFRGTRSTRSRTASTRSPGPRRRSGNSSTGTCRAGRTSPSSWCGSRSSRTRTSGRRTRRPSTRSWSTRTA